MGTDTQLYELRSLQLGIMFNFLKMFALLLGIARRLNKNSSNQDQAQVELRRYHCPNHHSGLAIS